MAKEENWLTEKMAYFKTVLEDFNNIYHDQLFKLCGQTISSDENPLIYAISCTKINILLNLKNERLELGKLEGLVFNLYSLCIKLSNDGDSSKKQEFYQERIKLCREIAIYQLLDDLTKITSLEYDKEYESTIYKKMVDCIFSSIQKNHFSKSMTMNVLDDVKDFLSHLTEKEKGELIVEHFTINYSRNQGIFFSSLSSSSGNQFYGLESSTFVSVMESLGEDFRSLSLEERINKLENIYQTDFYKKHFVNTTFGSK